MEQFRGTTIVSVRRNGKVAIAGDGQVSMGNTVMKGNARKVRPLAGGRVIAGFAGGTADAFTLFELFESKLEQYGNLTRAAIELARLPNPPIVVAMHPGTTRTALSYRFVRRRRQPVACPAETAGRLLEVLDGLTADEHGAFLNYEGKRLPW